VTFSFLSTSQASPNDLTIVIIIVIIIGEELSVWHGRHYSTDLPFQSGFSGVGWAG